MSRVDCRGWREIWAFLGVKSKKTAKRILLRHKILRHDGGRPVVVVEEYRYAIKKGTARK